MFKRFWWLFLVMLPIGALGGFMVAAVITYVMPKQYESSAVIEVKPRSGGMTPLGSGPGDAPVMMTPQFFGTEFEKIKSSNSLVKVVETLELVNKWGVDKETAIRMLKGMVNTQNIRGTDLISIRVRHTDKEDARNVTAEVARAYAYKAYRSEIENRDADRALYELNKAVRDQEDKVEERRKVLATIVRTKGIIYRGTDSASDSVQENEVQSGKDATETTKDKSSEDAIKRGSDNHGYMDNAKRDFETDQQLLQTMKLIQVRETLQLKMPDDSIVIHEEPQIAESPISPNVTLNLICGTVLGLLVSPLLGLLAMVLASRIYPVKEA